jgi:hypothetical protein
MRDTPAAQIREDALRQAQRRLDGGCTGCATTYAALAAQHGATRRDFLRYGLGGLAAVALAAAPLGALPKQADAIGCAQHWECWAEWVIITVCCVTEFFETICWDDSIDFTGWSCEP